MGFLLVGATMEPWVDALLVWGASYLVGAIPFGYLVARWRGVDIFQAGSGNIGATNVGRVLGKKFGLLVFVLDFAKGAVPVAAALALKGHLDPGQDFVERGWLEVGAGLAAFLGHLFPIYLRFRGGKGVATGAGVVAVLVPGPALGAVLAWVAVVAATGYVSLASMAAAAVLTGLYLAGAGGPDLGEPRAPSSACWRAPWCSFAIAATSCGWHKARKTESMGVGPCGMRRGCFTFWRWDCGLAAPCSSPSWCAYTFRHV